ncbi:MULTISPECIES: serpin family protein [unclassified Luteococcus]|uniref:serpin family protein n=1 Tax=unclassified Luteococcus TaxID=2639923 RepID=UPI00313D7982
MSQGGSMRRRQVLGIAGLAVAGVLAGCRGQDVRDPGADPQRPAPAGMVLLGSGENLAETSREPAAQPGDGRPSCTFAGALARTLFAQRQGDLLVSPTSLALPLAMLANGAKGKTLADLLKALRYRDLASLNTQLSALQHALAARNVEIKDRPRSGEVKLELTNALWAQQETPVKQGFLDQTARWYGAGLHGVDFTDAARTVQQINDWAAEKTHDRIKDLLTQDAVNEDTRLVLTNTVWFKAPWAKEFSKQGTIPFTKDDGGTTRPEVFKPFTQYWAQGEGWQATALDYLGEELAMAFVLPGKGAEQALLDEWADVGLHALLTGWRAADVNLTVPVWKHEQSLNLVETLKQLGITHLFPGQQVDLTGIREEPLAVSGVVQKTWIAVDEQGTEAAAATAAMVGATSAEAPRERHELVLNRPFWYVIFDRQTATPLFVGRVANPVP